MAIPGDFTIATAVTEGLKRGGIINPSAAQITDSTNGHFREVMKDIHLMTGDLPILVTTTVTTCVKGQSQYNWPTDARAIRSVTLMDAPDTWTGTAQAGTSNTITLASSVTDTDAQVFQGKLITITGGTGVNQINQAINWNSSTKVLTVANTWTTNPDNTSTYAIATWHRKIWVESKAYDFDIQTTPYLLSTPQYGVMVGRVLWTDKAPDRPYILWWDYWTDLDRIDQAGTNFLHVLRDYYNLIVEGVAAKVMARYDDDRAVNQLTLYNGMLANLASHNAVVGQVLYHDV